MLNVECYSAPQLFVLPCQYMMIDEDYNNVSVFAIESRSEDESLRDRSVLYTEMDTAVWRKVVLQTGKCLCDNVQNYCG